MDGYCWDDMALAERELADALNLLSTQNPFDPSRIIYAGASQGGLAAAYLALKNPARGFIAVVPSFGSRTSKFDWEPLLADSAQQGKRGVVITGEKDWALQATQTAVETMHTAGLEVRLEVVPNLGHDYPTDMKKRLKGGLEFVSPS